MSGSIREMCELWCWYMHTYTLQLLLARKIMFTEVDIPWLLLLWHWNNHYYCAKDSRAILCCQLFVHRCNYTMCVILANKENFSLMSASPMPCQKQSCDIVGLQRLYTHQHTHPLCFTHQISLNLDPHHRPVPLHLWRHQYYGDVCPSVVIRHH